MMNNLAWIFVFFYFYFYLKGLGAVGPRVVGKIFSLDPTPIAMVWPSKCSGDSLKYFFPDGSGLALYDAYLQVMAVIRNNCVVQQWKNVVIEVI